MLNVRLSKCGGIFPSLRIIGLAQRSGLGLQLGCHPGETAILSAAGRHVASRVDGLSWVEGSYDRHILRQTSRTTTSPSATAAGPLRWRGRGWESRSIAGPSKRWSRNGARSVMTETRCMDHRTFEASDGYPFHVAVWPAAPPVKGQVVVLHGVQSHSGWYHSLGRTLAAAGYQASFPDRRGSGPNLRDRGHAPSGAPAGPRHRRVAQVAARRAAILADHSGRH